MPVHIDDLFSVQSRTETIATMLDTGSLLGLKVTSWQPVSVIRTLIAIVAQKVVDSQLVAQFAIKGGFLDYAEGGWLTLLARSVYRVDRNLAKFAEGPYLDITNTEPEEYVVPAGEFIVAHGPSGSGKTYRNRDEITIPPSDVLENVHIIADETGTASDAAPGTIEEVVTQLTGVTVTNSASILGSDEESDPDLRTRCRDKLGSLSPSGPKEAYSYVAKTPTLAAVLTAITRTKVLADPVTGIVRLILATAAGAPISGDVDIVDDAIDEWATPWCVTAGAEAAAEVIQNIVCTVWVKGSTLTTGQIEDKVALKMATYFPTIEIGGDEIPPDAGKLFVDRLKQEIATTDLGSGKILKTTLATPAGDVTSGDADVFKLGTVTTTVVVVA